MPSESSNLVVVGSVDQGTGRATLSGSVDEGAGRAKLLTQQNYVGRHIHIIVFSAFASH